MYIGVVVDEAEGDAQYAARQNEHAVVGSGGAAGPDTLSPALPTRRTPSRRGQREDKTDMCAAKSGWSADPLLLTCSQIKVLGKRSIALFCMKLYPAKNMPVLRRRHQACASISVGCMSHRRI